MVERSKIRKDYQLAVRLREDEYNALRAISAKAGLSFSSYAREVLLGHLRNEAESGNTTVSNMFS